MSSPTRPRRRPRGPVLAGAAVLLALLSPRAASQGLELDYRQGRLGGPIELPLAGGPGEIVVLVPSGLPGPTPLSLVDPTDPRVLQVGIDLLAYLAIVPLDAAGQGLVTYQLPPLPTLAGAALFVHAVSLGTTVPSTPFFGDLSNPLRLSMLFPTSSSLTQGALVGARRYHSATTIPGGPVKSERVLLAGGESPAAPFPVLQSFEVYDPTREQFLAAGNLLERRTRHAAAALLDGSVLIVGGLGGAATKPLTSVERYQPTSNTVTAVAPMAHARVDHTATTLLDGRVLVVGGFSGPYGQDHPVGFPESYFGDAGGPTQFAPQAELYDPATGSWTPVPSIGPRAGHAAVLLGDGTVLVAGGVVPAGPGPPAATASCLRFDPASGVATPAAPLPSPRAYPGLSPALGGNALLVAGGDVTATAVVVTVDGAGTSSLRYDAGANLWSAVAPEPTPVARALVRCIRMPDGTIRYIRIEDPDARVDPGTAGSGPPLVHVLDTLTGAWQFDGQLLDRRPGMRVTDLESRTRCLVTGAAQNALLPLPGPDRSAEAYPYPQ